MNGRFVSLRKLFVEQTTCSDKNKHRRCAHALLLVLFFSFSRKDRPLLFARPYLTTRAATLNDKDMQKEIENERANCNRKDQFDTK